MRGKGDDLCDGSEVKGANFIDSLDKNGATAPRWNFNSVSVEIMETSLDKGTQRKTTENELPSLTQCTA